MLRRWDFEVLLPRLAREGRAVIAVCHDDRFFDCADRIIELRDGQLVTRTAAEPDPPGGQARPM